MNNSIDLTSLLLQIYNLILLMQDFNNSDLMKELQKQDKNYLEKIINQNNEILEILKRKEVNMKEELSKKLLEKTEEKIKEITDSDITPNNIENLYKLVKIKHITKEDEEMNYGNYGNYGNYNGRRAGYDSYGDYNRGGYGNYGEYGRGSYGRRGVDSKYRGDDEIDRMAGEYGRYQENRSRYGAADQETDKSFYHMVEAYKDFGKVLYEEAETPQQKQMLKEAIQSMMM